MQPIDLDDEALDLIDACADGPAVELLASLPGDQQTAIRRRHIDGRSYAEIALELRCSESVVRKRVSRGLTVIRSEIVRRQADD